ncbi:lasso peptide biosynthesis B2 protein [Promicromonospora kroppenstedtii]|uniref:Lasso peptide biosynthesis B2 protein n=1 Tax=Promicromonospora kroppenstedtii TaxID=440482 RepID=A0ABW7XDH7_9MICO
MSVTMAAPQVGRMSGSKTVLAFIALVLVIAFLRLLPLRVLLAATRCFNGRAHDLATVDQAHALVRTVRRAATWWPGRAACLEISLTTTWLAALRGRAVVWCHGVQVHPYTFHAWVEADGVPVDEPATTPSFLRTMTIPPVLEGATHDHRRCQRGRRCRLRPLRH